MAVSVVRAHAAHVVVFGLPVIALVGAVGRQELRARSAARPRTEARPLDPGSVGLRTAGWALLVAALVHGFVIPAHYRASMLYGLFFTVLALVQISCAWWIVRRPGRAFVRAVAISSACVIVLWVVTRTTGIPVGPTPWRAEGFGAADEISSALEAVTMWGCWIALHPEPRWHRGRASHSVVAR
jgi:hypothetical protein